jgi:hypothetical protein
MRGYFQDSALPKYQRGKEIQHKTTKRKSRQMERNPTRFKIVSTLSSETPKLSLPSSFVPVFSLMTSSPRLPETNSYDPGSVTYIHFPLIGSSQNFLPRSKSYATFCSIMIFKREESSECFAQPS